MFSNLRTIDRVPLLYDKMDDYSESIISSVSIEIIAVARAVERKAAAIGVQLILYEVSSVAVEDQSSLSRIFATCKGLSGIRKQLKKTVPDDGTYHYEVYWRCRYCTEDMGTLQK